MKMWAITAQVESRTADGEWRGSRQVATFYLHPDVQGITGADHAVQIAREILLESAMALDVSDLPTVHLHAEFVAVAPEGPRTGVLLDMRAGPTDHTCGGAWSYLGLNPGGHEVYRCDGAVTHYGIRPHVAADHVCVLTCGQVPERC
jgi:hypothetical protein